MADALDVGAFAIDDISEPGDQAEDVFTFDDIPGIDDKALEGLLWNMDMKELSKALISENADIRKKFYTNMNLQNLQALNKDMMDTERFTVFEKRNAQRAVLEQIAKMANVRKRLENGYPSLENFANYLLTRNSDSATNPYGIFDGEATVIRFSEHKNGEEILADIERRNAEENMGNIAIPNTGIKLINFSLCPRCAKVFSYKDLSDYYANPKRDARYKNMKEQFRSDTRVYCHDCGAYFLPALVVSDGAPKSEQQFLCRIQTMDAIEDFYGKRGTRVLSRNKKNMLLKGQTRTATGIRNDVFIKDMEAKPTLVTNLLQYTPAKYVMNIIDGSNYRKGDMLFGAWQ